MSALALGALLAETTRAGLTLETDPKALEGATDHQISVDDGKAMLTPAHECDLNGLWTSARADGHAPIGVMADHTHNAGEWMVSVRYMRMHMDQNYVGDTEISDQQVIAPKSMGGEGFLVTPTEMTTEMVMASAMYAPTDEITLMVMVPYVWKEMDHLRRDGFTFTTRSEGVGDTKFGLLWKFFDRYRQRMHLGLTGSAPTGSIDESDGTPRPGSRQLFESQLPYPMQIGSGTWDFLPSLTYLGQCDHFSWGAQVSGVLRGGKNENDYSLGNQFDGTAWIAWLLADWVSLSARVSGTAWGNISGADSQLTTPRTAIPTADPTRRGGQRVDVGLGFNLYAPSNWGWAADNRLAFEYEIPVYQRLAGPQLGSDGMFTVAWQYAW
ncbi:MAG: transporter [Verrucomicrobiota bacterium]